MDFVQWRALMRAYLWMDYASLFGVNGLTEARKALTQFLMMSGFLSLFGLMLGLLVWGARDPFFAAVLVITALMMWAGLMVVTQPASLASPYDHEIVGARPVTSRTYFAVRVTAMLVLVLETTVFIGWAPVAAFLTRRGGSLALAFAAGLAFVGAAVATAAGVVAIYGWLIRLVPPARLTRILGYTGSVISLALTAAYLAGLSVLVDSDQPTAFLKTELPRDLRTYWFPGAWFASYVAIAHGRFAAPDVLAAGGSGITLLLFASALTGRMSLNYAERVAQLATMPARQRAPRFERRWFFRSREARAVAILVLSHLRSDPRFQLALASNVMMGIIIVVTGTGFELPVDPFTATPRERAGGLTMPILALVMVPMHVYQTIASTTQDDASWLYFTTPADRRRIITAARDVVAMYVLLPLVLALGVFYAGVYRHPLHAMAHCLFLGVFAILSLQANVFLKPQLPFSVPMLHNQRAPFSIGTMVLMMLVMTPLALVAQHFAFRTWTAMTVVLLVLLAMSAALNALTRRRIAGHGQTRITRNPR